MHKKENEFENKRIIIYIKKQKLKIKIKTGII